MHGKECGYSCILQRYAAEAAAAGRRALLAGNHSSAANAAHVPRAHHRLCGFSVSACCRLPTQVPGTALNFHL
jgi:hypothetical protein